MYAFAGSDTVCRSYARQSVDVAAFHRLATVATTKTSNGINTASGLFITGRVNTRPIHPKCRMPCLYVPP